MLVTCRFMHTLLRASPHIQQGATIIAIGEKGHVPALLHELFKPKILKVTTTEFPGGAEGAHSTGQCRYGVGTCQVMFGSCGRSAWYHHHR